MPGTGNLANDLEFVRLGVLGSYHPSAKPM